MAVEIDRQDGRAAAVRAAAAAVWRDDTEFSARLVYRASRQELRGVGIATPVALYDEMKQVFWNADEGVVLGDNLSVGFGRVDRRRQVRAFAERHVDEPGNVIAKAYEREYGFSAGLASIWLDRFGSPSDIGVSEWLGVGAANVAELNIGECPCEEALESSDDDCHEAPTIEEFLARELVGDICDAGLVRRRFAFEFPDERVESLRHGVASFGYYEDRGLLFREGDSPNGHFTRLLGSHQSFAKGDAGFEDAVWQHPTFRYVLRRALSDHRVLIYEGDNFISFTRLHNVLGARMADIESYAPAVSMEVTEGEPFTVASLRTGIGPSHPLYELDMPDDFYEGLLDASGLLRSCTLAGTKVFMAGGEGRFSASNLIEWIVAHHEGVERDDLSQVLANDLGTVCPTALLAPILHNSDVYYDDIGDAYYSSMEAWKKEARNELA